MDREPLPTSDGSCVVQLAPGNFGRVSRAILATGRICATGFRYPNGVEALRISNGVGHIVVLPTVGQQVWDAEFHGRRLTMRSTFHEPVFASDYLSNYGAYLVHCGGSAMGNPGPEDNHALHGELPSSRIHSSFLYVRPATVTHPAYIGVVGSVIYRRDITSYFRADLELWLAEGSGMMTTRVSLTNLSSEARPLMYLGHVNFRPAVGGFLRHVVPSGFDLCTRTEVRTGSGTACDALPISVVDHEVGYAALLEPGRRVEPELVQTLTHRRPASLARFEQHHTDGAIDIVTHDTTSLPHTVRWLRRSAHDDAFGFALPATAGPDGLNAEASRGRVTRFPHGYGIRAVFRHGSLAPSEPLPPPLDLPDISGVTACGLTR